MYRNWGCYSVSNDSIAHVGMRTNDIVIIHSREFAKLGYRVALIARNADHLNKLAGEIKGSGGEVGAYRDYTARIFDHTTPRPQRPLFKHTTTPIWPPSSNL